MGTVSSRWSKPRPDRSKRNLILVLVFLVLFMVGLDYMGWITGGRSYIFTLFLGRHVAPDMTQSYQLITRQLSVYGIKRRSISGFMDRDKVFHLKVDLPLSRYQLLASPLETQLTESGAKILGREVSRDADRVYYLWTIEGQRKERLALLFSCTLPPRGRAPRVTPPPAEPQPQPAGDKFLALIMDDMGNSLEAAREVCGLGLPVTVSILPRSLHGVETAQMAHECGLEVMLHLPMESLNNHRTEKNTPGIILSGMTDEEVRQTTQDGLDEIPYIRGVNNHMGSKLTGEKRPLSLIFETMKDKGLYFIDSRTNTRSIACDLARETGIPAGASSLFIDPGDDVKTLSAAEIKANFLGLIQIARRNGRAIGIGHPRPATLSALKECLPFRKDFDVSFVFASRLAQK